MEIHEPVISVIREKCAGAAPAPVKRLAGELLKRHGNAVKAVLFYGSCLRKGDDAGGIVDLYLLVDDYGHAYDKRIHAFLNKLLPPNVFYLEIPYENRLIRAKYTVFSLGDFQQGTSTRWFHSYLWSRVSQPMGIVYTIDDHVAARVYGAMEHAVVTFISRVLPRMPEEFTARDLWSTGFMLTYSTELRAEKRISSSPCMISRPGIMKN